MKTNGFVHLEELLEHTHFGTLCSLLEFLHMPYRFFLATRSLPDPPLINLVLSW